ncbi:hypothetical protein QTP88_015926 [Uroleucon formosanum]
MNPDEINEVLDYSDDDIFGSDDGFSVFDDTDDDPDFRIGLDDSTHSIDNSGSDFESNFNLLDSNEETPQPPASSTPTKQIPVFQGSNIRVTSTVQDYGNNIICSDIMQSNNLVYNPTGQLVVGSFEKWAFGILNENDLIEIDEKIKAHTGRNKMTLDLINIQTRIVQSTLNNFNNITNTINENTIKLKTTLEQLICDVNNSVHNIQKIDVSQTLTQHLIFFNIILTEFNQETEELIESIVWGQNQQLHPSIINPNTIINQLKEIEKILPKQLSIPQSPEKINNFLDFLKLLTISLNFMDTYLIYTMYIPLCELDNYVIYHITPFPVPIKNNNYIFIKPSNEYLAISQDNEKFVIFTHQDYMMCKHSLDITICNPHNIIIRNTHDTCEVQLFIDPLNLPVSCDSSQFMLIINNYWLLATLFYRLAGATASGLINYFSSCRFLLVAMLFQKVFFILAPINKQLQAHDSDILIASQLIKNAKLDTENLRSKGVTEIKRAADDFAKDSSIEFENINAPRKKRVPRNAGEKCIDEALDEPLDNFKVNTYYVVCDTIISELCQRFGDSDGLLKDISLLSSKRLKEVGKNLNLIPNDAFVEVCSVYKNYLDRTLLIEEYQQFVRNYEEIENTRQLPKTFRSLNLCNEYNDDEFSQVDLNLEDEFEDTDNISQDVSNKPKNMATVLELFQLFCSANLNAVFPTLYMLLKICVTLPVSGCSVERSFSKLKLLKTKLRSTMIESRLEHLMIINCERDIPVDKENVIQTLCTLSSSLSKSLVY